MAKDCLVIVDVQNDFLPGGPLGVPEGDRVVPVINRLQETFSLVAATQDWHPADHGSFAASHPGGKPGEIIDLNGLQQILWPVHCVRGTPGAEFAPGLDTARFARVFQKGTDPGVDSYSGLFDNGHRKSTGLADWLRESGRESVTVVGLATDYCVKFTVLDFLNEGFAVRVIADGCRGVNLRPGDADRALEEMIAAGARIV